MSREEHSISAKEPQKTRKSAGKESCISTHGNGYPAYDRLAATGIYAKESYLSAKELCISITEPYISAKKLYVSEKEICMSAAEPYMSDLLPPPCNTQQHTSTNRNTLQYTDNTLQHNLYDNAPQQRKNCVPQVVQHRSCLAGDTETHCSTQYNTLQHTATRCNALQHIANTATHLV